MQVQDCVSSFVENPMSASLAGTPEDVQAVLDSILQIHEASDVGAR